MAVALVDADNFYVSCERVFAPRLATRPVVVLSNNDGCAIARSAEAKLLGIGMGQAVFQLRDILDQHGVALLSSNFTLYGDMSSRLMDTLSQFCETEVYSIDEGFCDFTPVPDRQAFARELRSTVHQWTGLPVSIGVGHTKVHAKAATRLAKKHPSAVCDLTASAAELDAALAELYVGDVWGIGPARARLLRKRGIEVARQLAGADTRWIRRRLGIVVERIVWELRGVACLPLALAPSPRKSASCARTFGRPVALVSELREAVGEYAARATRKLRRDGLVARSLSVWIATNQYDPKAEYTHVSRAVELPVATANEREIAGSAVALAERLFEPGLRYRKAGVWLGDVVPGNAVQGALWDPRNRDRDGQLQRTLDEIADAWGPSAIRSGRGAADGAWAVRAAYRTPRFTTRWDEVAVARAE
jgi:DNA polymerase V